MHFSVHRKIFHYFLAVAFEATVMVVEFDAVDFTEECIEYARREYFVPWVMSFFFITRDDVPAFTFIDFFEESWYFFRVVLKVGIEGEYYFTGGFMVAGS